MTDNFEAQKKLEALAHDLNNVLSNILSSINLVKQGKDKLSSRQKFLIDNIENDSARAAEMLENVLNKQPVKRKINPKNLIADLKNSFESTLPPNITIVEKLSPNINSFLGVYSDIYRSLFNLLINAKEAMNQGGEITIEVKNLVIDKTVHSGYNNLPEGNYVEIKVRDTGEGISEENIPKIFSDNFSTKIKDRKSGIGLNSVKNIIAGHKGQITVSSQIGKGTEFAIALPSVKEYLPDEKYSNDHTILITEDDEKLNNIMEELLSSSGYNVITSNSGEQSLEIFKNNDKIDLIIIDRKMPGLNGLECIKKIREANKTIPIILSSGSPSKNSDELLSQLSINSILNKPYNFETMIEEIKKLIS